MATFQLVCLVFLPLAYYWLYRIDREVLTLAPVIFLAAWLGEASSVAFYGFYHYDAAWWLRAAEVPLLVPLIWPPVILSARAVVRSLWPEARRSLPLLVGVVVFFDAAMVEVLSVGCGLWWWTRPGYLGVPLIGVVGWAVFAAYVTWLVQMFRGVSRWAIVALAPLLLHPTLVALWRLFFKWNFTGDWFGLFVAVVVALTVVALVVRRRHRLTFVEARPRLVAAGIFICLLVFAEPLAPRLWLHVALTSIPYALVTDFQSKMFTGKPS